MNERNDLHPNLYLFDKLFISVFDMINFVNANTDEEFCHLKNSDSLSYDEQQTFYKFCNWNLLLQIYLGIFLPIMLTLLVGINVVVWSKLKINYKLVFDFDIRNNVDYREFWEVSIWYGNYYKFHALQLQ